MLLELTFDQLRTLVVVQEAGSANGAARILDREQSSVQNKSTPSTAASSGWNQVSYISPGTGPEGGRHSEVKDGSQLPRGTAQPARDGREAVSWPTSRRSTRRGGIEAAQRRLTNSATRLADEPDIEALRLRLTSAQARTAQAPTASEGGNSTKRGDAAARQAGNGPAAVDDGSRRKRTEARLPRALTPFRGSEHENRASSGQEPPP